MKGALRDSARYLIGLKPKTRRRKHEEMSTDSEHTDVEEDNLEGAAETSQQDLEPQNSQQTMQDAGGKGQPNMNDDITPNQEQLPQRSDTPIQMIVNSTGETLIYRHNYPTIPEHQTQDLYTPGTSKERSDRMHTQVHLEPPSSFIEPIDETNPYSRHSKPLQMRRRLHFLDQPSPQTQERTLEPPLLTIDESNQPTIGGYSETEEHSPSYRGASYIDESTLPEWNGGRQPPSSRDAEMDCRPKTTMRKERWNTDSSSDEHSPPNHRRYAEELTYHGQTTPRSRHQNAPTYQPRGQPTRDQGQIMEQLHRGSQQFREMDEASRTQNNGAKLMDQWARTESQREHRLPYEEYRDCNKYTEKVHSRYEADSEEESTTYQERRESSMLAQPGKRGPKATKEMTPLPVQLSTSYPQNIPSFDMTGESRRYLDVRQTMEPRNSHQERGGDKTTLKIHCQETARDRPSTHQWMEAHERATCREPIYKEGKQMPMRNMQQKERRGDPVVVRKKNRKRRYIVYETTSDESSDEGEDMHYTYSMQGKLPYEKYNGHTDDPKLHLQMKQSAEEKSYSCRGRSRGGGAEANDRELYYDRQHREEIRQNGYYDTTAMPKRSNNFQNDDINNSSRGQENKREKILWSQPQQSQEFWVPPDEDDDSIEFHKQQQTTAKFTESQAIDQTNRLTTNIINVATRLPEIEKFSNSPSSDLTFSEWLDSYELNCRALSIPKENWGKVVPLYLTEGAMVMYRSLIDAQPDLGDDYGKLIKILGEEFNAADGVATSVDLNTRTKQESESVGKFYASITSMARRLFPTMAKDALDQIILASFVRGLPLNYKKGLLNNPSIQTAAQAFKAAQRMERTNLMLLKDSIPEMVNTIGKDKEEELEAMKRSLKNLEMRQAELLNMNRERGNDYRRWSYQGHQPNIHSRNYNNPQPNWKQNYGRDRQLQRNHNDNWRPAQTHRRSFNNNSYNHSRRPNWDRNSYKYHNNNNTRRNDRPWRHDRMQAAQQYNQQHEGQEFTTYGRPQCRNYGATGYKHYQCNEIRKQPHSQKDRKIKLQDSGHALKTIPRHTERRGFINTLRATALDGINTINAGKHNTKPLENNPPWTPAAKVIKDSLGQENDTFTDMKDIQEKETNAKDLPDMSKRVQNERAEQNEDRNNPNKLQHKEDQELTRLVEWVTSDEANSTYDKIKTTQSGNKSDLDVNTNSLNTPTATMDYYEEELMKRIDEALARAHNTRKMSIQYKQYYDRKDRDIPFRLGDRCYLFRSKLARNSNAALTSQYSNPYRIVTLNNGIAGIVPCTDPYAEPKRVPIQRLKLDRKEFTPTCEDYTRDKNFNKLAEEMTSTDYSCNCDECDRLEDRDEHCWLTPNDNSTCYKDLRLYNGDSFKITETFANNDGDPDYYPLLSEYDEYPLLSEYDGYHFGQKNDADTYERDDYGIYKLRSREKQNKMPDYLYLLQRRGIKT